MALKKRIITLYKKKGETPLECITRFKSKFSAYANEKMTYAGRLDPMAEGLLLVLVGKECKNKEKYFKLDKVYEVDILFGFATDTYDILGKIIKTKFNFKYDIKTIKLLLKSCIEKFFQKYPPFSSKTIRGEKLFSLFKSGKLKNEEIPEKEVEIKSIKLIREKKIDSIALEKYIDKNIFLVKGDFRQRDILKLWHKNLQRPGLCRFPVVKLRVCCTSGTYMRSLANSIGEKVGIPALALNIKRIKLGRFEL